MSDLTVLGEVDLADAKPAKSASPSSSGLQVLGEEDLTPYNEVSKAVASVPRPAAPAMARDFERQPAHKYEAIPGSDSPEAKQIRLGRMVPDAAVPALDVANRYAVQPFNRIAEGAATGAKNAVRTDVLGAAEQLAHPDIEDPELAAQKAEREHPLLSGAAEGIASLGASTVADPRNWPFFGAGAARPLLQRLMSRGFAAGMTYQSAQALKNLHDNWPTLTPEERAQYATQTGIGALIAATALHPRVGLASSPEGSAATATILGGDAGAGVARTPEATVLRAKVGPFTGSVSIPRNGASPSPALEPQTIEGQVVPPAPPDPVASAMAQVKAQDVAATRAAKGIPPPPPPAPPTIPDVNLDAETVQRMGALVSQLPPELRQQGMIEAHEKLSQLLLQKGKLVGPDGKLHIVENEKQASSLAQSIINDEVERHDQMAAEAAKAKPQKTDTSIADGITKARGKAKSANLEVLGETELPSVKSTPDDANRPVSQNLPSNRAASGSKGGEANTDTTNAPLTLLGEEHLFKKGDQVSLPGGETGKLHYLSDSIARVEVPKEGGGTKRVSIPPAKLKAVASSETPNPPSAEIPAAAKLEPQPIADVKKSDILFARHGSTRLDQAGGNETVAGWSDESLDERGVKAAHEMAGHLKDSGVTKIIASDLPRAKETADIVGKELGLPVETDERLRPQRIPETEGKKVKEIQHIRDHYNQHPDEVPQGGESKTQFTKRQDAALEAVEKLAKQGEKPLVVTHSTNLEAELGQKPEPGGIVGKNLAPEGGTAKPANVSERPRMSANVTSAKEPEHPHLELGEHAAHTEMVPTPEVARLQNQNVQMVPTSELDKFKEYDRRQTPGVGADAEYIDRLKADIQQNGLREPLIVRYGTEDRKAHLWEGNHRLAAAKELGIKELPVRVETAKKTEDHFGVAVRGHQIEGEIPKHLKPSEIGIPARGMGNATTTSTPGEIVGKTLKPEGGAESVKMVPGGWGVIGADGKILDRAKTRAKADALLADRQHGPLQIKTIRGTTETLPAEKLKLEGEENKVAPSVQPESKIAVENTRGEQAPSPEGRREVPSATRERGNELAPAQPGAGKETRSQQVSERTAGLGGGASRERSATSGGARGASEPSRGVSERGIISPGTDAEGTARRGKTGLKAKNRDWFSHPEEFSVDAGNSTRLQWNLKALDILKKIQNGDAKLTDEDRDALAHYVGWGALQWVFDPYNAPWKEQQKWCEASEKLRAHMSDEEFRAARKSTMNAHFTSPEVVRFIWNAAKTLGFKGGVVLEPSMGTGNFFGMMPAGIRAKVSAIGNELDPTTYNIAKLLYPSATLFNKDYAHLILPDNSVDLAVGNVPFGEVIYDPHYPKLKARIHDYFIVKSLDKLRPGGVAALITSTGTLDKPNSRIREIIADNANLIYALRFPAGTFEKSAGTHVTTDLLVFQKREPGDQPAGEAFTKVVPIEAAHEQDGGMASDFINEYFDKHPQNLLGTPIISRRMYGSNDLVLKPNTETSFADQLKESLERVPKGIIEDFRSSPAFPAGDATNLAPDALQEGSYFLGDKGQIQQKHNGGVLLNPFKELTPEKKDRITKLIGLRDTLNELMGTMKVAPNDDLGNRQVESLQKQLIGKYHDYLKSHGLLHDRRAQQLFSDDPHYPRLLALEYYDRETKKATPAEIFTKRTILPREHLSVLSQDSKEALFQVLNERGRPDIDYMAGLSGKAANEIAEELSKKGLVFRDPVSGDYKMREDYLSGYVREKLQDAKAAVAQGMKEYQPNVEALEKAIPDDVPLSEINVRPGATWIPPQYISDFLRSFLRAGGRATVSYHGGAWKVDDAIKSAENISQYGNDEFPASRLLEQSLNLKQATSYDVRHETGPDGKAKEKLVVNPERTAQARDLQEKINEHFARWMRENKEYAPKLERIYNDRYNGLVTPEYDGAHLSFPGMNTSVLRDGSLMPHQKNAIWRLLQDGRGLLAHVVGAGKTYEMITAGMEMRRMGSAKKPVYAVPNHLVGQWAESFSRLYPGANILVPSEDDFSPQNRRKTMARIATNEWDAIIMPHSHFNLMDISPERQRITLQKDLDELEETIRGLGASASSRSDKRNVKQLEKSKANLEAKITRLASLKSDNTINFDDTGIDALFVDEAHEYKNLVFYTKMNRVAGLAQGEAMRATRLKMKTDYLLDRNGGRGVIFATGTPVQNTMAEMYNMIRYVAPDVLEKAGIRYFDDWAANFGKIINAMELSPDAETYRARSKFAEFINLPELQMMFTRFADVKTVDDLPELKSLLPKLEGGKPVMHEIDNPDIEPLIRSLVRRAAALRGEPAPVFDENGKPVIEDYKDEKTGEMKRRPKTENLSKPTPEEDNMLLVTNDGRLGATDLRLLDPNAPARYGKINTVAQEVFKEWKASAGNRGTQLVFMDRFRHVRAKEEKINLYRELTHKLTALGVPKEQIAIIHDYKDDEAKLRLFDQINKGNVRVLIGSTQKMGAGMNAQMRMVALHHVDLPWKPGELEQRTGRLIRQGNMNSEVREHYYLTKHSFDAYMAQLLQTKAKFIWQAISGKNVGRSIVDAAADAVLSYEEMKAISSGNPDVRTKMELEAKVRKLEMLDRQKAASVLERKGLVEAEQNRLAKFHSALASYEQTRANYEHARGAEGKEFRLDLLGKTFTDHEQAVKFLETQEVPTMNIHASVSGVPVTIRSFNEWDKPVMEYMLPVPALWSTGSGGGPESLAGVQNSWYTAPVRSLLSAVRSIESTLRELPNKIEKLKGAITFREGKIERLESLAKEEDKHKENPELTEAHRQLREVNQRLGIDELAAAHEQEIASNDESDNQDERLATDGEEAQPQSLASRLHRDESGAWVLSPQLQKTVGSAIDAVGDYLERTAEATRIARTIQRTLENLDFQKQADILDGADTIRKARAAGVTKADDEAVYFHREDPEGVSLTSKQDDLLDDIILPILDDNTELYKEASEGGMPIENYISRTVRGKGGMLDRIAKKVRGLGGRGSLSKSAPALKQRTMMAIESPEGERRVVSIKGRDVTMWDKGEASELGELKNAKGRTQEENETFPEGQPNSAFFDKGYVVEGPDGYDWKLTQATTKEIEGNTNLEYYHSALASVIASNIQLRSAVRAARLLKQFKASDDFKEIAIEQGRGNPPKGWKTTDLPQFKGYYFEPRTAEVLDWYYERMRSGDMNAVDQLGQMMRVAILLNPLMHPANIAASFAFEKGVSGFIPQHPYLAAKSVGKAITAGWTKNEDFKAAQRAGGSLQSARDATKDLTKLLFEQLADGLDKKESWAMRVAESLGIEHGNLIKGLHNLSSKIAWISGDMMMLQAAYQWQYTHPGVDLADALKEVGRIIPEYRVPTRILDQAAISKLMVNKWATIFGPYHYSLLKSFAEAGKAALGVGEPGPGQSKAEYVAKGWDRLALLGLAMLALGMVADKEAQKLFDDKHVQIRRPGPLGLLDALLQVAEHKQSVSQAAQRVVTPAPQTKAAAELMFNREFYSGRQIYDPHAKWSTQWEQIKGYLVGEAGQIGQAERAHEDTEQWKRFWWRQVGVNRAKTRAEKLASDIAASKVGTEALSPEERDTYVLRHNVLEQLRKGNDQPLESALSKGELSHQQAHTLRTRARRSPLEDTVHGFTYPEVWKVYQAAKADHNQEEMQQLERVLRWKRGNMFARGRSSELEQAEVSQ